MFLHGSCCQIVPPRVKLIGSSLKERGIVLRWFVSKIHELHLIGFRLTVRLLNDDDQAVRTVKDLPIKPRVRAFFIRRLQRGRKFQVELRARTPYEEGEPGILIVQR